MIYRKPNTNLITLGFITTEISAFTHMVTNTRDNSIKHLNFISQYSNNIIHLNDSSSSYR